LDILKEKGIVFNIELKKEDESVKKAKKIFGGTDESSISKNHFNLLSLFVDERPHGCAGGSQQDKETDIPHEVHSNPFH